MIEGAPPWHVLPDVKHEQGRLRPLFRERSKANCWGFQPVSCVVQMKSPIADMKNTGVRYGGAITAALFLRQFVDTDKACPTGPAKLHTAAACQSTLRLALCWSRAETRQARNNLRGRAGAVDLACVLPLHSAYMHAAGDLSSAPVMLSALIKGLRIFNSP